MQTIRVVELDEKGEPTEIEDVQADAIELPGDAVIVLNPGVPPLGSPEFETMLAEWHRVHNGVNMAGIGVG